MSCFYRAIISNAHPQKMTLTLPRYLPPACPLVRALPPHRTHGVVSSKDAMPRRTSMASGENSSIIDTWPPSTLHPLHRAVVTTRSYQQQDVSGLDIVGSGCRICTSGVDTCRTKNAVTTPSLPTACLPSHCLLIGCTASPPQRTQCLTVHQR